MRPERTLTELLAGIALLVLGSVVLSGWALHAGMLVQLLPGAVAMVPNTAIGFILAGLALTRVSENLRRIAAVLMIALAAVVFSQFLLGIDLGVDHLFPTVWVMDPNPTPGRMAPQTALCFIASGIALLLLDAPRGSRASVVAQVLTLLVGAIGIVSLIGYSLKLELLYSWYRYTRMAVHTAAGFAILGAALWYQWYRRSADAGFFIEHEDRRINVIATALIVLVVAIAGSSGFVLLAAQTERVSLKALSESLASKVDLVSVQLHERTRDAELIASRQLLSTYLRSKHGIPTRWPVDEIVPNWLGTFIRGDVTGIRIHDVNGGVLISTGQFARSPQLALPLNSDTTLQWDGAASLRFRFHIRDQGRVLGSLVVETQWPVIAQLISESSLLSQSGDLRICHASTAARMQCLPSRTSSKVEINLPRTSNGMTQPMTHALEGRTGAMVFRDDHKRQVIGAYAPLDRTGLGLVLQQDTEDLYAPLRRQLQFLLLVMGIVVTAAITLLRSQVAPLLRHVIEARADASASAARTAAIMNSVPDGIITIDADGRIVSLNPAISQMFGYSDQELLGQTVGVLMPTQLQAAHDAGVRRYMQGAPAKLVGRGAMEVPARHRDGHVFTAQLTVSEMRLGDARYIVGNMRDITAAKVAEAQMRALNERLKLATQAGGFGVWEWDLASSMFIWDARMHELHGTDAAELMTYERWRKMLHPADLERVERDISEAFAQGKTYSSEFRILREDGQERIFRAAGIVARDSNESAVRITGVNWDVTESKKLDRMKSEFVSVVSHELRTPLTSIRGSLGLLNVEGAVQQSEKARRLVDIAYRNTDRLSALINDILDIEKIESGGLVFAQDTLDLNRVLEHAVEQNQAYAAQRKVRLELEPSSVRVFVTGDQSRLLQVLANLLSNAAKYSPEHESVRVKLVLEGEQVRVSVSDRGSGIPENFAPRIFQKFSQADSSDTRAKGGTGLGLAISKAIVERHGGVIDYVSKAGEGTTFFFVLPVDSVEEIEVAQAV